MNESKKIAFDVSLTFIATSFSFLLGIVLVIILSRFLGPSDLGVYRLTFTIFGIINLIATLGLPSAIIKFVAEYKADQQKVNQAVTAATVTSLFIGIGLSFAFFILSGYLSTIFAIPGLQPILTLFSPIFPFALVGGVLLGVLNGIRDMKNFAIATIVQALSLLTLAAILIYYGFGVFGVVIGNILASIIYCFFLLGISLRYFRFDFGDYRRTIKDQLSLGGRIVIANSINQINYQVDIILIGIFLTAAQVGYYSIAVTLSTFFWLIPQAIQTITYPAITQYWTTRSVPSIQMLVNKSIKYCTVILVPIGLAVSFFSPEVVGIFGAQYGASIIPTLVLLVGTIINGSVQRPIGSILYSLGLPQLNLYIFSAAAIANVVLNLWLIPTVGILGASLASDFSYIFITVATLYYMVKVTNISVESSWLIKMGFLTLLFVSVYYSVGRISTHLFGIGLLLLFLAIEWLLLLSKEDRLYFIDLARSGKALL